MILVASFPASGNTFFHNILKDVYSITPGYFNGGGHAESGDFLSTHLLPASLPQSMLSYPSVCIVRDGRDACVSLARSIQSDELSPLAKKIQDVTIARRGDYYGGWSIHTAQWIQKAEIVIRYEDLIEDPIREIERLRTIYPTLPKPNKQSVNHIQDPDYIDSCEDMTQDLEEMFWGLHGDTMHVLQYKKENSYHQKSLLV